MSVIPGYEFGETLYQGARSVVRRARREADGARVVIKLLAREFPSPAELGRFRREYDILSSLQGIPGTVRVLGLERRRSVLAIVMEDDRAESLAVHLRRRLLGVREALSIALSVAGTLGAIHRKHVIHKDINPTNLVVVPPRDGAPGGVKIIDFGLATLLSHESPIVTNPNVIEGTLRYISPEQTGRVNRAVDYRSDFYSLGVTLYELLTGELPFQSDDPVELVHRHIAVEPRPPVELRADIPRAVSDIVLKLLAKTAEARYQSTAGLAADLEECLAEGGAVSAGFVPGRHDFSERLEEPQRLYGREQEVATLLAAFDRVARGGAEVLLCAGYSGVGKSAVVQELQAPVLARRGFFISGKLDQLNRGVPYAALIQAFQGLVRRLLTEQEDALVAWRKKIEDAVGPNGSVITAVIPEVALIIGAQPAAPALPPTESQNRFNFVLQSFVRAFATASHPLVVFLDDLQWADAPSLNLIQLLATDPGVGHLLLLGAYRDNEVTGAHPLVLAVEAMTKAGAKVSTLLIEPLGEREVAELVADCVRRDVARSASLAALAFDKTRGNPFFLNQFLRSLADEGLLSFDAGGHGPDGPGWRWDIDEIRRRGITDNVVELMVGKIQRLPEGTQRALKLAACIGNRFDLGPLAVVSERSRRETAKELWAALVEGLVVPAQEGHELAEPSGDEWAAGDEIPDVAYRFLHDRVQQAAYSLIPEGERSDVHLTVGRLLWRSAPADVLEERLFDVVNHLDLGVAGVTSAAERLELARLNLHAGRKAKGSVAYEPALRYLQAGLDLLPEGSWKEHHDLAFALHAEAMETAYLTARLDRARELALAATAEAVTVLEKVKILETRMLFHTARNEIEGTLATAHEALALLGVPLPPIATVDYARMVAAIVETGGLLAGRRAKDLVDLPGMTDPQMIAALRIMATAGPPTYIASPLSFPVLACAMVNLCLRHGNYSQMGYGYSSYGLLQPDVVSKNEYGDLSLEIGHRYGGSDRAKSLTVVAICIRHWKVHVRESLEPLLLAAVRAALEVGDLEFVGYASMHYCKDLFYAGEPLPTVDREVRRYVDLMARFKLDFPRLYLSVTHQAARNLMGESGAEDVGRTPDPIRFAGEAFDEETMLPVLVEAKNIPSLHLFWIDKAIVAYVFRAYPEALAAIEKAAEYVGGHVGMSPVVLQCFYHSLALLASAAEATPEERDRRLALVEKNQADLKQWAEDGPANYRHKYLLVEAERGRVTGRATEAADLYDQAIRGAADNHYVQEEAMASERCAELHFVAGRTRLGETHLAEARHAYERWGALAKVADIDRRHPRLHVAALPGDAGPMSISTTTSAQSSGGLLDLATVMRAARAISGEIVLSRLVDAVLRNVVENAGAQRGVLLLEREGRLEVQASHELAGAEPGAPAFSEAIVNYAVRTGESVILGDATAAGGPFAADPYLLARRPRSVLAAPLVSQGKRVAVVYLENNLAPSAFTEDRLEVIRLLLAQAALSIQNARLYESVEASNKKLEEYSGSLEVKVQERTRELTEKNAALGRALADLRTTQEQLITQEKLASLGALTAGIAHEIKNPLNFVTNFASLSTGFVDELTEGVRIHVRDGEAREDLGALLADLRENVGKIEHHGRRANGIIDGMLLHARTGSAVREQIDLNALVNHGADLTLHGLRGKEPDLELDVERDLDPAVGTIEVVAAEMSRVFVNVLNNAWYATLQRRRAAGPGYRPKVVMRTRAVGAAVEVRIRDNGTGIPADIVDKIYNPFFTTKPTGEGTGLGLSISYDIVTKGHQGRIEVEAVPGGGAEFVITLPRRLDAGPARSGLEARGRGG